MHRLTLFLAAVLLTLTACATSAPYSNPDYGGAYAQAAPMPAPVQVPAMTPGFAPGTPSAPVYSPAGAGLPEVGQPGQQGASVKRSPNTRVLPDEYSPKKEPGLWAADGAPRASALPLKILDVPLEIDHPEHKDFAGLQIESCTQYLNDFIARNQLEPTLMNASKQERTCFVGEMLHACAGARFRSKLPHEITDEEYANLQAGIDVSYAFKKEHCLDIALSRPIWKPSARTSRS